MKAVVVIPTYNEAGNLGGLIEALFALSIARIDLHVLIVDDRSPDGTAAVAQAAGRRWPGRVEVVSRTGKLGLASAYVTGFDHALAAGAAYIGQMDADGSHDPASLPLMFTAIADADVVIGSRYAFPDSRDARAGWYRRAGSRWANRAVVRLFKSLSLSDLTSGFRLWRRAALLRIDPHRVRARGYGLQVEMAYLAASSGCRIVEIPIHFHERQRGRSKMTFLVQLRTIREIAAVPRLHRDAVAARDASPARGEAEPDVYPPKRQAQ